VEPCGDGGDGGDAGPIPCLLFCCNLVILICDIDGWAFDKTGIRIRGGVYGFLNLAFIIMFINYFYFGSKAVSLKYL
jgi:hypothetical protein